VSYISPQIKISNNPGMANIEKEIIDIMIIFFFFF
jgi:altronate dehydratase